ncbi:MAG: phage tail tape measure protein [Rheinheimera sp.]|uniref:phage tail tape measure protein n=1 Tax=Arsukibacterium sp. UBA3155 TaxID=1946058 RepID=UPI000C966FC5|nr:phage tail tape measure protein [Arsukibacterium sp. UBA3155]MAD75166.1 phage tail tape measure protein [Rheinheimera sp.]|tara:strand:- start:28789 stop:31773 length:2985 start_codon:yes stop_codon:yes gene_type:complete
MSTKSLGQLTLDMILKTGSYTEPLDKATRQTKAQMKEIEKSSADTTQFIQRSFAALGLGVSLNEIRKYSDSWTDLNGRVRLAVGPMGDANKVMGELEVIARKTYSSLEGSAEGYLLNASALTELGYSTQQQLQFTNALAAGLVASGAKQERAMAVTNALSKAIAEGVLRGDNWNTVFQTGGEVADALARGLGVSRIELDKLARSGQLTTDKVVPALIGQLGDLQAKADSMATTVGDAFLQLDNAALRVFGTFAEGSNASGLVAASILGLADNLETVIDIAAIAAAVMAGRLAGAATANAIQFVIATREAMRYQLSLAAMSGVSANTAKNLLFMDAVTKNLNRSLAFLGGPVGLLFAAGAAASYFALTSKDGADDANTLRQNVDYLNDSLEKLNVAQAGRGLVEIQPLLKSAQDDARTLGARVEYLNKQLKEFPSNQQAQEWRDELAVVNGKWSDANDLVTQYRKQLQILQQIATQGDGSNGAPPSAEFEKQAAALEKQISLFGANTEAAKLLYEIQSGNLAGKVSGDEQKRLLALAQQYDLLKSNADAAKKLADEQKKAADTVAGFIENARETSRLLQAQVDGTDELGRAQQELIKFEAKLAEIRGKDTLTAIEQEMVAQEEATRAQLEKNVALEAEVKQRQTALRLAEYTANLQLETGSYQEQYQIQLGLLGLSEKQRQIESERLEINRDITRQKQDAFRQMQDGDIDPAEYDAQLDALDEHLTMRLELFDEYYEQLAEREGDWTVGAITAMQDYIDNAKDIAGQTEEIFGMLFSGLEDSVLEFVKTGEFSMRDLMSAIAEDVIRMLIRIGIQKAANYAMDKLFGAAAATGYVASITGQATAQNFMAGLNAFTSTAAIPIVGPALAPGAMAAALAISSPLAVGAITAASSSLAGMAHNGLDYIPNEGTWLLDKGERVLSPRQNEDLTRFLSAVDQDSGRAGTGGMNPASGKVELQFNFAGLQNEQLMEMLMENRGAIAGMVSGAFEDQGIRLA